MDFMKFKRAVASQFSMMSKYPLFRTGVTSDVLWPTYLEAFPPGSNEIYKERREYDCNCCKHFIRAIGNVVTIIDGVTVSLWDIKVDEPAFQQVADTLAFFVKRESIVNAFRHYEPVVGTDKTLVNALGGVQSWQHFHLNLPRAVVMVKDKIPTKLGEVRTDHDVLVRSLKTITSEAIDSVLDLISQNSLYRGQEHLDLVKSFQEFQRKYRAIPPRGASADNLVWLHVVDGGGALARIRNTVIGTLLVDLSEGKELEMAVKSFEDKVAPTNYKRPTALVTPGMIVKAKQEIESLGLSTALERRYATLEDITVNNILFANREARQAINADVFDELTTRAKKKTVAESRHVEDVPLEKFIRDILPRATSVEVLFENRHAANLVSLIAPVDPTAAMLFKWPNAFSWSYAGEMADSIKERVKAAGGNVTGDLCCRLAWDYEDDLDLHMIELGGSVGGHIYFGHRVSINQGRLDVDANGMDGIRPNPVENISYVDKRKMKPGEYVLSVNNYNRRSSGMGFTVEIEAEGQVIQFQYEKALRANQTIDVALIEYDRNGKFAVGSSLQSTSVSRELWGKTTQNFHQASVIMNSPNHWDGEVGNKHIFFMLAGCKNPGTARGFFNEFLLETLTPHRKVIEMVGSKLKVKESDRQLSGLGFSLTSRNKITCRISGAFSRVINVVI